jgi:hypothetical protein
MKGAKYLSNKLNTTESSVMNALSQFDGDAYALLQLKRNEEVESILFEPMDRLESMGLCVNSQNYEVVYAGALEPDSGMRRIEHLNQLFYVFNCEHPADFYAHSMSISDVIILRLENEITCHYVDWIGFKDLLDFLDKNHLRNAEMSMEDDYGMIDGVINNDRAEKPSVLERIRNHHAGAEQASHPINRKDTIL